MNKIFTLLSVVMMMFAVTANAQSRKTWDFTKGVSDESRALLDADGAKWTKTANDEGVSISWATNAMVTGELIAGEKVIPEFAGLQFGDFAANNAVLYRVTTVRLQKNCTVTIPGLKAGQKIAISGQSANATAEDRGIGLSNAAMENGENSIIFLGKNVTGAPENGVYNVVFTVTADGDVVISSGLNGAPKSGIEINSIIIDEGDKNIKKWDFSAFSAATVSQVCAAEDWTTAESASKNYITGNEIRWINDATNILDANEDLAAGGAPIKELKGLRHTGLAQYNLGLAFNYGQTLDSNNWGPYKGGSYIWVMGTGTTIVVPNVKSGSTFKIGVETHKLIPAGGSDARGFQVLVNGAEVGTTQTTTDYKEIEYAIPASDDEYVNVTLKATKGCHLYFIEAEVKDETVVDKNASLGAISFSLKDGAKVAPTAPGFTMTFPKAQNLAPETKLILEGYCGPANAENPGDYMFDGVEGTLGEGITFTFSDYAELVENSEYEFYLTKLIVEGYDKLSKVAAEGEKLYPLSFTTTGPGINEERAWEFATTAEEAAELAANVEAGYFIASSKGRYSYSKPISNDQLMLNAETAFAKTEGLYFTMGTANDILIGTPDGNNGKLQLGGGTPTVFIPSCSAGDEVTIKALWSTKNSGIITITNGTAEDGTNVINLTGSAAEYKITVAENGDLALASKNVIYNSISVFPSTIEKKDIPYTIVAQDANGNAIKTLVEAVGKTNDNVSVNYSYWLADAAGKLYTRGTKGTPFTESFKLEDGKSVYPLAYKEATVAGLTSVAFVTEGEDIEGTMACTQANSAIRSSNAKAAYATGDVKVTTLQPGTYKMKAVLFDNGGKNTPKVVATLKLGDKNIELWSAEDNFTEVTTEEAYTITEATDLVLLTGGTENYGLDCLVVYNYDASQDIPDDPDAVNNATAAKNAGIIKVMENGQAVIKTLNGTFNAAGAQQ